jgi:hypothetical protein
MWLSACHKWVEVEPPSRAFQEQSELPVQSRDEVRLHIRSTEAKLEGDPLTIGPDSVVLALRGGDRVSIAPADVTRVDVRRANTVGTIGLVAGIVLGGLVVLGAAAAADLCSDDDVNCTL